MWGWKHPLGPLVLSEVWVWWVIGDEVLDKRFCLFGAVKRFGGRVGHIVRCISGSQWLPVCVYLDADCIYETS